MGAKQSVERAQAESEATRDESLPAQVKGEKRGRSVVQSVRLPAEKFAAIEQIAEQAGVPVSALIRGWVLHGLAAERDRDTSLRDAIEHLAADTERLRRLASTDSAAWSGWAAVGLPQNRGQGGRGEEERPSGQAEHPAPAEDQRHP